MKTIKTGKQTTGPLSRFIRLVHNSIYNPMLDHQTAQLPDPNFMQRFVRNDSIFTHPQLIV